MTTTELTEEEKDKRRREQYERSTMTVDELWEALGELRKKGDGDAMIAVDDNFGGSYALHKFGGPSGTPPLKATTGKLGKWISLGC